MQNLLYSFRSIGPVFFIIALGILCRRLKLVDKVLASRLSRLVFFIFLPSQLIRVFAETDFIASISWKLLIAIWGPYGFCFLLACLIARLNKTSRNEPFFFASGATWGNVAILGFALAEAFYGNEGLSRAAILAGLFLSLHIAIGIISMNRQLKKGKLIAKFINIASHLIRNPIIIACGFGVLLGILPISIPPIAIASLDLLSRATLPISLIAIGASLEFGMDSSIWLESIMAAGVKLILLPVLGFVVGNFLNIGVLWTGSLTIAFSCPTAISFFIVSRNLGYDASRGAAIVTMTTLGAVLTTGFITALLNLMGYV